jgi:ABC-type transport system involved in multi-copper enzyme maturation permease subunit
MKNLPTALYVLRWMVRDTFRQALGSRAFWLVFGLNALAILLCLSVSIDGYTAITPKGEIELMGRDNQPFVGLATQRGFTTLAFGLIRLEQGRDGSADVLYLQSLLAKFGAGALGILLVLLWTSGFLPEFLQAESASVLLAKPVPRWAVLVGKYIGVVVVMAFQTTVFVGGTWLALGLKTGAWFPGYLYTIPIVVVTFAILFSVMTLLAVCTRSAVVSVVGTLVFWIVCAGVTNSRHDLVTEDAPSSVRRSLTETGYWVLPKTVDLLYLLHTLLSPTEGQVKLPPVPGLSKLEERNEFHPELSAVCSLMFGGAVLILAARRFALANY